MQKTAGIFGRVYFSFIILSFKKVQKFCFLQKVKGSWPHKMLIPFQNFLPQKKEKRQLPVHLPKT